MTETQAAMEAVRRFIDDWEFYYTPGQGIGNPVHMPWEVFEKVRVLAQHAQPTPGQDLTAMAGELLDIALDKELDDAATLTAMSAKFGEFIELAIESRLRSWADMANRTCDTLGDRLAELTAERDRLKAFVFEVAEECECRCDEAWTMRGLHDSPCLSYLSDQAKALLSAQQPPAGKRHDQQVREADARYVMEWVVQVSECEQLTHRIPENIAGLAKRALGD